MKHPALYCLILALSAGTASAQVASARNRQQLNALFSQARSKFIAQDFKGALDLFSQYLEKLPKKKGRLDLARAQAHYGIAASHVALGNSPEAHKHLEQAVDNGFWSASILQRDPTFERLRGTRKFDDLLKRTKRALAGMAFGLKDLDGNVLKKKDYEGKVLIIDVWGTWCPPCRMEIPHFIDLQAKYRDKGLRIIGLTWEQRPPDENIRRRVKRFAETMEINYPCVMATRDIIMSIPNMQGYPTTFFVDRNGIVRNRLFGLHPYQTLERHALKLLREKKGGGKAVR